MTVDSESAAASSSSPASAIRCTATACRNGGGRARRPVRREADSWRYSARLDKPDQDAAGGGLLSAAAFAILCFTHAMAIVCDTLSASCSGRVRLLHQIIALAPSVDVMSSKPN